MHLSQREQEKLLIHVATQLARARRARGLQLNSLVTIAILAARIIEGAHDVRPVADLMAFGRQTLTADDVQDKASLRSPASPRRTR